MEKKQAPKVNKTGIKVIRGSTLGLSETENGDPAFRYLPNGATSVGGAHRNAVNHKTNPDSATPRPALEKEIPIPNLTEDIIEKKLHQHPVV